VASHGLILPPTSMLFSTHSIRPSWPRRPAPMRLHVRTPAVARLPGCMAASFSHCLAASLLGCLFAGLPNRLAWMLIQRLSASRVSNQPARLQAAVGLRSWVPCSRSARTQALPHLGWERTRCCCCFATRTTAVYYCMCLCR